jgi:hypothetical protein
VQIGGDVSFEKAGILTKCGSGKGRTSFAGAQIGGYASFDNAKIGCPASSYVPSISFDAASISGPITFKETKFACLKVEEAAYRSAKQNCKSRGATADADNYFYREMVARRKQKKQPIRALELVVQYGLGYGTRPSWLLVTWILIALLFGITLSNELVAKLRVWLCSCVRSRVCANATHNRALLNGLPAWKRCGRHFCGRRSSQFFQGSI